MTTDDVTSSRLLARADLLLLIRDLLTGPIRSSPATDVSIDASEMEGLLSATGLDPQAAPLAQAVADVAMLKGISPTEWTTEHSRLFEGPALCPVNESAYVRRDKGAIIADLCGFYRAFGFDPASGTGEKADHLATELEFLAMLLVMEHQAPTPDDRQVASKAMKDFVGDHIGEWIPLFCMRLEQLARIAPHRAVAVLLQQLWSAIAVERGLPVERPSEIPATDDGTPYVCGMDEQARCGCDRLD